MTFYIYDFNSNLYFFQHIVEWICKFCKILNKSAVISNKPYKLLKLFYIFRFVPIFYCFNFIWVSFNTIMCYYITQKFYLTYKKFRFFFIYKFAFFNFLITFLTCNKCSFIVLLKIIMSLRYTMQKLLI